MAGGWIGDKGISYFGEWGYYYSTTKESGLQSGIYFGPDSAFTGGWLSAPTGLSIRLISSDQILQQEVDGVVQILKMLVSVGFVGSLNATIQLGLGFYILIQITSLLMLQVMDSIILDIPLEQSDH